jgi:hypothetical protein
MFVISLSCEMAEAADPGFYVGVAGGRSEQKIDKAAGVGPITRADPPLIGTVPNPPIRLPLPPIFTPVPVAILMKDEVSADETDIGWNVALGYRVNQYLAAEVSYIDSGEASLIEYYRPVVNTLPVALSEITRSYTVSSRGPALSVLGSWPLSAKWGLFVRGGVLFAKQEVEARTRASGEVSVPRPIKRDFSDEVVSVGAGVQWAFLPRWTARLEYQRSDDLQANEIMGESRIDQASLSVLFRL